MTDPIAPTQVPSATPRVLVTAGPTHEPIDSVRYLANRSSGRMGIALAEAAIGRGWPTTLLLGPTTVQPPECSQLRTRRFQTAADLQQLLAEEWPRHDILFMAAAVADFTPVNARENGKLKRSPEGFTLELQSTPDLLAELAKSTRPDQRVIGFALEPAETLLKSAGEKLRRKRLDAIVANPLETMDSPRVTATVIFRDGTTIAARHNVGKLEFAQWLLETLRPIVHPSTSFR